MKSISVLLITVHLHIVTVPWESGSPHSTLFFNDFFLELKNSNNYGKDSVRLFWLNEGLLKRADGENEINVSSAMLSACHAF